MNYYRHIDRTKIQFDFLCDEDSTDIPYDEIESLGGKVILIPPYQKVFKYQKAVKKILKDGNYKIVHSHINTLSVFPLRAAKKAGVPIRIAHSHATTNKIEIKRNAIKVVLRPLNKIFATNYACCSEHAGRWMFGNDFYDKDFVKIINNAIDTNKFIFNDEIRKKYRNSLGIKDNQTVIGCVGRMVKTKNHIFLLDVFDKVCDKEDAFLVLIGKGPLENEIRNIANKLKKSERIFFLGQKEDVSSWYQAFDILVLPSLYEGFGMTLLEAQASNLPCLTSTNVPKEVKIIEKCEFLPLKDGSKVWADNVIQLIKNSKRKTNGNLISLMKFDIRNEALDLEKWYFKLYFNWMKKNEKN